jgi:hypothetical protein
MTATKPGGRLVAGPQEKEEPADRRPELNLR